MRWILALLATVTCAYGEGERAGDFDYYVLSLSWSPNWCAIEGDDKGSDQCDPRHDHGWIMHGLWPQFETGWPSFCKSASQNPTRSQTNAMADIMGTSGLAWYQWNKHGKCSGLEATAYYALARDAYGQINRPEVFRKLTKTVKVPADVVEKAFLEANPALTADMITITCKNRRIQEARICLTKDLEPRVCGTDVQRDCTQSDALFDPIR